MLAPGLERNSSELHKSRRTTDGWRTSPLIMLKAAGLDFTYHRSTDFDESFALLSAIIKKERQRNEYVPCDKNSNLPPRGSSSGGTDQSLGSTEQLAVQFENEARFNEIAPAVGTKTWIALEKNFTREQAKLRSHLLRFMCGPKFWEVQHPYALRMRGELVGSTEDMAFHLAGRSFRTSDIHLLLKKIARLTTRNDLPGDMVQVQVGRLDLSAHSNIVLSPGQKVRRIIFGNETASALSTAFNADTDENKMIRSRNNLDFVRVLQRGSTSVNDRIFLSDLVHVLESYEASYDLGMRHVEYKEATGKLDDLGAVRVNDARRALFTAVSLREGDLDVGGHLAEDLNRIAGIIAQGLESFSEDATRLFQKGLESGISITEAKEIAVSQTLNTFGLRQVGKSQSFFFGIDFMLSAPSKDAINSGEFSIIISDVNLNPLGPGLLHELGYQRDAHELLVRIAEGLTSMSSDERVHFLVDSQAFAHNEFIRIEILKLADAIHRVTGHTPRVVNFFPLADTTVVTDNDGVWIGGERLNGGIWRLRDGFFGDISGKAVAGLMSGVMPNFFFLHAIQDRIILNEILTQLQASLGCHVRPRTRRVSITIDEFIGRFERPLKRYPKSHIELWRDMVSYLHDFMLEDDIFVKAPVGKVAKPIYISLRNPFETRQIVAHLKHMKNRGCETAVIETMDPSPDNLWYDGESRFTSELRVFMTR